MLAIDLTAARPADLTLVALQDVRIGITGGGDRTGVSTDFQAGAERWAAELLGGRADSLGGRRLFRPRGLGSEPWRRRAQAW
jgi:hypothetical protein